MQINKDDTSYDLRGIAVDDVEFVALWSNPCYVPDANLIMLTRISVGDMITLRQQHPGVSGRPTHWARTRGDTDALLLWPQADQAYDGKLRYITVHEL